MLDTLAGYYGLAVTLAMVLLVWQWHRLIPARSVLVFMGGFVYWCLLKILIVVKVHWVVAHSPALAAGTSTLLVVGLYLFVRDLKRFYAGGGTVHSNGKHAAELVALAAEAAQRMADAALKVKELAIMAATMAAESKQAADDANEQTKESRK